MPKKEEEKLEEEIKEGEENLKEEENLETLAPDEDEGEKESEGEVDDKKVDDKPDEIPKFTLPETAEISPEDKPEDEKIEIVHNGQVYKLTKDKLVELAQKGFDYDFKVGPHGKLAQMIDSDPGLSKVVDDYWQGKVVGDEKFEVKPLDNYESEEAWLADNLKRSLESAPRPQAAPQSSNNRTVSNALQMRDPEHFNMVLSKIPEYAKQLTVVDYQRIDSDMGALCQFYDFVKEQEIAKISKVRETKAPGFRVKSGGGESPKADSVSPAWKLSKEDFQKQLDRVKGYS